MVIATGLLVDSGPLRGQGDAVIPISRLMPAPAWALAERELLARNAEGVELWASKYLDANGYLLGATNWGIADGPDDAVESIRNWPLAHALGGPDTIIEQWDRAWEGHLDQYTKAKDPSTELARNGMYYKEFPTAYDWEHIGEGLGPFYWYGLSRPADERYAIRLRRWAGLYMNEDPEAQNYDAQLKIIPSLFNGSKGAKLTPNTQEDWNGRLLPGTKPSTRFLKATNVLGDHPLNLASTNLAFHAYLVTQEAKYKTWLLEYVDAWKARIAANGGNIPSNVGRNGQTGAEWDGKWYGGVFGWNSPDEGVRNYVLRGPPEAFGNALLLTGDQGYTQVLRTQVDNLYANSKVENGRRLLPRYYGDQGWYGHHDGETGSAGGLTNLREVETDIYLWGLQPGDLERLPKRGWIGYLTSGDAAYPLSALQQGLADIQRAASRLRADTSTPDFPPHHTRGSGVNPVATEALINLTLGANDPNGSGHGPLPLHAQVRHFDPERRRAGLPDDVAALVERIRPESVTLTLVNVNPLQHRTVTVQMGAYGEHRATSVTAGERTVAIDAPYFTVRLAPGAGETLTINLRRYAQQPTLAYPWE
ncbi:MAG: hypothetical protein EHM55_24780 [Acidobacteria bacterium]|nr:MAG: hypothetical protein EHM55_24780 [Acidobacteriota bacterium]